MRTAWCLILLLLAAAGVRADTIYMKGTGLRIEGKILRETDEYIIVLVKEDTGQVRIDKKKIDRIEYDIKTQLASLKEDDHAGKYKVGLWAMEKGMFNEAIELFETLRGKEGPPSEMLKKLGAAYEQREQWDKALVAYSDYLKGTPDDKEAQARVAELTEKTKPAETGKPTPAKRPEGLEASGTWAAENWNDVNPSKVSITNDANGNKIVVCQTDGGAKDKVAFSRGGQMLTFAENKELVFKVYSNVTMNLAVAFTNQKGDFHETKQMRVNPNTWTKLSVNLRGKDFKSNRNEFKSFDQELQGLESISRIVIMPYVQRPFLLYVDDIFATDLAKQP